MAQTVEQSGGGNAIIVSHGMTIGTFMWLIDHKQEKATIDNGSVSVVSYKDNTFSIETIADMSYRHQGRKILEDIYEEKF